MNAPTIAIDLGGTNIKAGIVDGTEVLASESIPANSRDGLAPQLPRVAEMIERLCASRQLKPADCRGIGMAVPFLVDPIRQRIRSVPREKYGDACDIDLPAWARQRLGIDLKIKPRSVQKAMSYQSAGPGNAKSPQDARDGADGPL